MLRKGGCLPHPEVAERVNALTTTRMTGPTWMQGAPRLPPLTSCLMDTVKIVLLSFISLFLRCMLEFGDHVQWQIDNKGEFYKKKSPSVSIQFLFLNVFYTYKHSNYAVTHPLFNHMFQTLSFSIGRVRNARDADMSVTFFVILFSLFTDILI